MIAGPQVRNSFNTAGRTLKDAPLQGRIKEKKGDEKPWMQVPRSWPNSALEWYVEWYLTRHGVEPGNRKYRRNIDYLFQDAIGTPGLFAGKQFTRADFVLLREKVVLDPYTTFTHPSPKDDHRKRIALARAGFKLIFLWGPGLEADPGPLIELARQGTDVSPLGNRL